MLLHAPAQQWCTGVGAEGERAMPPNPAASKDAMMTMNRLRRDQVMMAFNMGELSGYLFGYQ